MPTTTSPAPVLPALQAGDWVLRLGPSRESSLIRQASGGEYSHIGMVVSTTPQPLVVHATTDDDPAHPDQVLLSPLADFIAAEHARHFAIARPQFLSQQQRQQISQSLLAAVGQPFVLEPRHLPHRYCTTLLADAISRAYPAFAPTWQNLDLPVFRGEYLFPRAFTEYPGITWLYRDKTTQ